MFNFFKSLNYINLKVLKDVINNRNLLLDRAFRLHILRTIEDLFLLLLKAIALTRKLREIYVKNLFSAVVFFLR